MRWEDHYSEMGQTTSFQINDLVLGGGLCPMFLLPLPQCQGGSETRLTCQGRALAPDDCRGRQRTWAQVHLPGAGTQVEPCQGGLLGAWIHTLAPLLTDRPGQRRAGCPDPPQFSFRPQCYLPPTTPRLGRSWVPRGLGDSCPTPVPLFGCENQLLLGWNVPCSWNSLSFPEVSDGHIYALLSIIAQEDPGASVWQLQGPGDSG